MTAAWATRVTDACNAMRSAAFGGTLARDGAGAFGNAPLPANRRDRRAGAANTAGCYEIVEGTRDGRPVHVFANPYVLLGGILAEKPVDTVLEDLLPNAEADATGGPEKRLFVALRLRAAPPDGTEGDAAAVVGYGTLAALHEAQGDRLHHVIPLYLLGVTESEANGEKQYVHTVACDFRRGACGQQVEVLA